jgi:hypothetical protein
MSLLDRRQMGDFTIFRHEGCMGDDIAVKPGECAGADMLVLTSLFMDYGHVLNIFILTEEEYQHLQSIYTSDMLEEFVNGIYRSREHETSHN